MSTANQVEARLIKFAVQILHLCDEMPRNNPSATHIRNQLIRSGTAPAPNYGEARGAESDKDFIHKRKITQKELNETHIWLRMIIQADMLPQKQVGQVLHECDQLCRIIGASISTTQKRMTTNHVR